MIKYYIVILSVCTLFAPLVGLAQNATPEQTTHAEPPRNAQKISGGSCVGAGFGVQRVGTVSGIGGNWGGPGAFWIDFLSSGTFGEAITTEQPVSTIGFEDSKLMFSVLSTAYLTGQNIVLYCNGMNQFQSVWLNL
jgi:hypothetical protein